VNTGEHNPEKRSRARAVKSFGIVFTRVHPTRTRTPRQEKSVNTLALPVNLIDVPQAAEVRPDELADLACRGKEYLAKEDGHRLSSSQAARDAGEVFRRAWQRLAPEQRWYEWLKENGFSPRRVTDRMRIYDQWSSIPAVTAGKGVEACLIFLRTGRTAEDEDEGEEDGQQVGGPAWNHSQSEAADRSDREEDAGGPGDYHEAVTPPGRVSADDEEEADKPHVHVAQNSGEQEWYTPRDYLDVARAVLGGFDLDPASSDKAQENVRAARYYTKDDDGLSKPWAGRVWLNPPYAAGLVDRFIDKLASHFEAGDVSEAVVLVNNATETTWFRRCFRVASAVCFLTGRVKFLDKEGNPSGAPLQGQAVLYLGPRPREFVRAFRPFGNSLAVTSEDEGKPETNWVDKECQSVEWYTPPELLECVRGYFGGPIPLDPATAPHNPTGALRYFTAKENGLKQDWAGEGVFVNPPYGKALPDWCRKIHEEADKGVPIIALMPCGARFSTTYWQDHILSGLLTAWCYVRGRVAFVGPNGEEQASNPYDSAIYGFNADPNRFARAFEPLGQVFQVGKVRGSAELIVASTENEWYTPARYVEAGRRVLGGIDLDPASSPRANETVKAARFFTAEDDGLAQHWSGRVWLNPPYGRLAGAFARKLVDHYAAGDVEAAVLLVNAHCTDTDWFAPLWDRVLCFTDHRIDFDSAGREKANASTHGSVFAYFGREEMRFRDEFSPFGPVGKLL
jgi:ParB family chromosome partitioning protein